MEHLKHTRSPFPYNIVLIGFMGVGKSTVSRCLSAAYAMDVVEMDHIIAQQEGMSIPEIFRIHGEKYFRDLETRLLIQLQDKTNVVISCGGGTPLRERNVAEMKKNGRVVLLTARPETILERVKDDHGRPLLEDRKSVEDIALLMSQRQEKYQAAADITVWTDGRDASQICEEIAERLRKLDETRPDPGIS